MAPDAPRPKSHADPLGRCSDVPRIRQRARAVRARQGGARGPAVGDDRRRRRFARRHLRGRLRACGVGPAPALPEAGQPHRVSPAPSSKDGCPRAPTSSRSSTATSSTTKRYCRKMYWALAAGDGRSGDRHARRRRDRAGGLSPARQKLSDLGAWFFRRIAGAPVTDPMSGFFMIRREIVAASRRVCRPTASRSWSTSILSAGRGAEDHRGALPASASGSRANRN